MAAAESVERLKQENEQLKRLLREERLSTDWLNDGRGRIKRGKDQKGRR